MYSDDDYERYDRYERKSDKKSDRRRQDSDDDDGDSEIINIRPFDFNTMSPFKGTPNEDGIKIIIIGKAGCFAPGTKVLMYDGTIKCIEDVKVGEQVMGDDNTPRTVQRLFHDTDEMFEIVPKRGPSYTVNRLHDLVLSHSTKTIIISVEEYLKLTNKDDYKLIRCKDGIDWEEKEVDSYSFGYTLSSLNQHIPYEYKINSKDKRRSLLKGIMDKGDILTFNSSLIDDINFISRSLGNIEPEEEFTVVPKGVGEYYGFELDGNRLFLLDTFDVVKNSGKSSLIKDIIASKAHLIPVAQVYSGTEDSNHAFSSMIPDVCVFNKLDLKGLEQFKYRQKIAKKYLKKPFALQIIDDCTDDPKILKKPIIQDYYKNGRHWNMLHILTLQYCLDIPPAIRNNYDYAFIFKENIISTREKLHKYFGACIQKFSDFNNLLDTITGDYTALVIKNSATATTPEECLFWYKANPDALPKNWKFGSATAWEFQQDRRDPNAVESLI